MAASLLVIAGIAGTILPALPGTPLVFLGLLLAAWMDHFQKVGGWTITILAVLTILSLFVDVFAVALGVKRVDASRQAIVGAMLGTFIGLFMGIPGLIFGPLVGAAAGEFIARRDLYRAGQVGLASWLGMLLGSALKLALTFLMVGLFILAYFWK